MGTPTIPALDLGTPTGPAFELVTPTVLDVDTTPTVELLDLSTHVFTEDEEYEQDPESFIAEKFSQGEEVGTDGAVNETERDLASALITSPPGAPSLVANLKRLYEMFKAGRVSEGTFLATKMNFLGVKGTI